MIDNYQRLHFQPIMFCSLNSTDKEVLLSKKLDIWPDPENGGEWSYIQLVSDHQGVFPRVSVKAGPV